MRKKTLFIIIVFGMVVTCGVVGLVTSEGYDILNALFFTILMFFGNYADPTTNVLINIARYGAIILTTTTILLVVKDLFFLLRDYVNSKKQGSIFLFGDNEYAKDFLNSDSNKVINRDSFMKTDKYVLLDEEKENLKFYSENKDYLKNKDVYLKSETFSNQVLNNGKLHYFSIEQLSAKKYWVEKPLLSLARENDGFKKELNIVFVGFNSFAEEILYQSLVINIFSTQQKVKYHIFEDKSDLINYHKNFLELNIQKYDDSHIGHIDIIDSADKVLFFEDFSRLTKLLGLLHRGNITYFTKTDIDVDLLNNHRYGKNSLITLDIFNYTQNICNKETIINENEIEDAKKLNAAYGKQMGISKNLEEQWIELSTFHKFSNISCVDYFKNTIVKLMELEIGKAYKDISDEEFNKIVGKYGELEHIRWVNYHLFCNWEYSETTNKNNKQHNCLVIYDELSELEKLKDENQIKFIREILKEC